MSNLEYYLLWLLDGLLLAAAISAVITRHLNRRMERRAMAAQALDALTRHAEWVMGQRKALLFAPGTDDRSDALPSFLAIRERWFPELKAESDTLWHAHTRLSDFMQRQQALRARDAEAWLLSDFDLRLNELWQEHLCAMESLAAALEPFLMEATGARSHGTSTA